MNDILDIAYKYYYNDIINSTDIFSYLIPFDIFITNKNINNVYIKKVILKLRYDKINHIKKINNI